MTRKDVFWLSVLTSAISTLICILLLDAIGEVNWKDIPMAFGYVFVVALIYLLIVKIIVKCW